MYACFISERITPLLSLRVTVDGVDFHSVRVSAATRESSCVFVCSVLAFVCLFFVYIHRKRSKFVLFYVFMRMYSAPDCRQCKDENIQFVSYCSSGNLLQPTHTRVHTHTHTCSPFSPSKCPMTQPK